jgi:hypothetical protein
MSKEAYQAQLETQEAREPDDYELYREQAEFEFQKAARELRTVFGFTVEDLAELAGRATDPPAVNRRCTGDPPPF